MMLRSFIALMCSVLLSCSTEETAGIATDDVSNHTDTLRFLALGDSYTIGESVAEDMRWPVQLVDSLATKGIHFEVPEIIARTGWTTGELKAAIDTASPDQDYDMVSLLIGVNDQYRGGAPENYPAPFLELLNMAIRFAGGRPERVIVISIPDYGYTPFGKSKQGEISQDIDAFNAINQEIATDRDVHYYNITPISRNGLDQPALVAADGLHPSGLQYSLWVEMIANDAALLKDLE